MWVVLYTWYRYKEETLEEMRLYNGKLILSVFVCLSLEFFFSLAQIRYKEIANKQVTANSKVYQLSLSTSGQAMRNRVFRWQTTLVGVVTFFFAIFILPFISSKELCISLLTTISQLNIWDDLWSLSKR